MSPRRVRLSHGLAAVLATATALSSLVACGDASTAPRVRQDDSQLSADIAASAGDAVAAHAADLYADETLVGIAAARPDPGGIGRPATPADCAYDAATKYHVCSRVTERGLSVVRQYQFRDAAGTPMERYDAERTASINFKRTVDGSASGTTDGGGTWTKSLHELADRTVSGLAGAETQRVWNGTGSSADTSTHSGANGTRTYAAATTNQEKDVVVRLPRASYPWPQSGTVTRTENVKLTGGGIGGDRSRTLTRTVVVTFNGTSQVPITVNGLACTLDLEARRVSGCARR